MTISRKLQGTILSLALSFAFVLAATSAAHAEEEGGFWNWLKKVVHYPVKTGENTLNAAGHAVENTAIAGASAVQNTGATLSGQGDKLPQIVAEPAARTVNMAGQLASETAGAPVKAAEDVQKE